ncbi:16S rRNA (cytidine(1402)-2'-O)-methyltransferase [Roseateles sp. BYS180W]|uniref:Ribosomal RNA small subunit methyltransferase I n=1 Tax=Roseateles rivi TaxID=3299028 RepID=A0ABW7FXD2_9BURK
MASSFASVREAAAQLAGAQQYPAATLYLVSTPIGNLADISLRALHVLGLVDAVACEDTRVSGQLLNHLGLHKPLLSLHQHNEMQAAQTVLQRLQQGQRVAYVSDAGTPAISDPGAHLVAAVRAAGLRVLPLPGASSVVTALSVAGDAQSQGFHFVGFLPPKGAQRLQAVQALANQPSAQVLFEAPHRMAELARQLADVLPQHTVTVCRELTKQFESVHTLAAEALPQWLAQDHQRERGEFVVVVHAKAPEAPQSGLPEAALRVLQVLLRELPLKQASSLASELTGAPRKALYQQALDWKDSGSPSSEPADLG